MAVFAPMPNARVRTATNVNPGAFTSIRSPYFTSCHRVSIRLSSTLHVVHPSPTAASTRIDESHLCNDPRPQLFPRIRAEGSPMPAGWIHERDWGVRPNGLLPDAGGRLGSREGARWNAEFREGKCLSSAGNPERDWQHSAGPA